MAGTAGLLGARSTPVAAEPPPETTRIRLLHTEVICYAPYYVAEELLRSDGFVDVQYVKSEQRAVEELARGKRDFVPGTAGQAMLHGNGIVLLTGLHLGCYELFASDRVRRVRDLRGKTISITSLNSGRHVFLASMLAYVGLDPRKDVELVEIPPAESMRRLAEGKIDAFMAFPPEPLELRRRKIGHVLVNTLTDRPWSEYFCCMMMANRDFVRKYPVATKRALRAFLKAADLCALEPNRAARFLVDRGYTSDYDDALQTVKALPYGRWRELDPTDTVRFYALRLHEAGMIKATPQKLIAQGTDWRFLNELKKELKG